MLCSTKAIVLHQIKYRETSLVLHLYTREYGRISGIASNVFGKKSVIKANIFQPLYLLDLQIYYKAGKDLHRVKEARLDYLFKSVHIDIKKSTVLLFLAETLYKTLKEEAPNEELFDFISQFIIHLDEDETRNQNLHLWFLLHLIHFLGFSPGYNPSAEIMFFDILNARYTNQVPPHSMYLNSELTHLWGQLLSQNINYKMQVPSSLRRKLLDTILVFYKVHIDGFSELKSYPVLKEIFN